jgi:hypothetical protein
MAHTPAPPSARDPRLLLERIARRCVEQLEVEDVGIAVATGPNEWTSATATTETADALELYALTVGEGPSVDALRDHAPVMETDLAAPSASARWPAWSAAAQEQMIRSVAAFPIHAGAITAGALTLYFRSTGALPAPRYPVALRLTDLAFMGLLDLLAGVEGGLSEGDANGDARAVAELLRADVHRAAGMIMAQAEIPIDQALAWLRARAFSSGRSLAEVAADVLSRRLRFEPEKRSAE